MSLSVALSLEWRPARWDLGLLPLTFWRGSRNYTGLNNDLGRRAVGFTTGADALHACACESTQPQVCGQAIAGQPVSNGSPVSFCCCKLAAPGCDGRSVALEV